MKTYQRYYDVVILPPATVRDQAIQISKEVKKRASVKFTLGQTRFVPHISLYHVHFRKSALPKLKQRLKKILDTSSMGIVRLTKLGKIRKGIWIEIANPRWLQRLHERVVKECHKLRDRRFNEEKFWYPPFTVSQRKNLKTYGTPYFGQLHQPHISLTVLNAPENQKAIIRSLPFKKQQFKAGQIALFQLGPHHTCQKQIFSISD